MRQHLSEMFAVALTQQRLHAQTRRWRSTHQSAKDTLRVRGDWQRLADEAMDAHSPSSASRLLERVRLQESAEQAHADDAVEQRLREVRVGRVEIRTAACGVRAGEDGGRRAVVMSEREADRERETDGEDLTRNVPRRPTHAEQGASGHQDHPRRELNPDVPRHARADGLAERRRVQRRAMMVVPPDQV